MDTHVTAAQARSEGLHLVDQADDDGTDLTLSDRALLAAAAHQAVLDHAAGRVIGPPGPARWLAGVLAAPTTPADVPPLTAGVAA